MAAISQMDLPLQPSVLSQSLLQRGSYGIKEKVLLYEWKYSHAALDPAYFLLVISDSCKNGDPFVGTLGNWKICGLILWLCQEDSVGHLAATS